MRWPPLALIGTALLAAFIALDVTVPARAENLPVVYRGPGSPTAEFSAPYAIRVLQGGVVVALSGSFSRAVPQTFIAVLAQAPGVRTIRLDSPGGLVQPAMEVASIIKARGLDTYVERFCASACTLAYLGGRHRFLGPAARLGFHQAQAPNTPPERADPVLRQAYTASGVPPAFIDHVLHTPPQTLWFPTPKELTDAGIVTGPPPKELSATDSATNQEWAETIKQMRWASTDALSQFATAWSELLDQLQAASPEMCWGYLHHAPADLGAHASRATLDALTAALRRVRDDVAHAPTVGIDEAEKTRILAVLIDSLQAASRGPTVAALRPDGDHAAFCPALRTMLNAALALPGPDRGSALHALLDGH